MTAHSHPRKTGESKLPRHLREVPGFVIMRHIRYKKFETTERSIRQGKRFIRNANSFAGL